MMASKLVFGIPPAAPTTACRSCGAPVIWIITKNGKRMPVEAVGDKRGESHFAHCEHASMHRRPR